MPVTPWSIAIAGVMGSGKTTLAKNLARALGWALVPEGLTAIRYLTDLFSNTSRWAYETQVAFLTEKAIQILACLRRGSNVLVDRSLDEDVGVFAHYWRSRGDIDERGFSIYSLLSKHFLTEVPPPDLVLYCDCSEAVVAQRILQRGRDFQRLYPPDHVRQIFGYYREWLDQFDRAPVFVIDTERNDFRDPRAARGVAEEVVAALATRSHPADGQLALFEPSLHTHSPSSPRRFLSGPVREVAPRDAERPLPVRVVRVSTPPFPYAYIAAPFSAAASAGTGPGDDLFGSLPPHGIVPAGRYRNALNRLAQAIRRCGYNVSLPHRDINRWGRRTLTPEQVIEACTEHITHCSLFFGVLAHSHGAHFEAGVAEGLKKPSIIVHCEELGASFVGQGLRTSAPQRLVLSCARLEDIPRLVSSADVREFLRNL